MIIPHASSLWPKALFDYCMFSTEYPIAVDYHFALRIHNLISFYHVDYLVACVLPGGVSNKPEKLLSVIAQDFSIKNPCQPLYWADVEFQEVPPMDYKNMKVLFMLPNPRIPLWLGFVSSYLAR